MSFLLIVSGPPGAGKSTLARVLVGRYEPSVLVQGDAFFGFLERGAIEPWLPEAHEQNEVVTRAAAAAAGRYAAGGFATLYDGLVGPWFLPTFLETTGLDRLEYVVLLPGVDRCVQRVTTRRGHGFTDDAATRHMHRQFVTSTIDPRHVVPDPTDDPEDIADIVVEALERGRLSFPRFPTAAAP